MKRLALALLAVGLLAGTARADVTLKMSRTDLTAKDATPVNGTVYITPDKAASLWEPEKKGEPGSHVIYRGDKQLLWIITDGDKKYMEMTKESIDQLGGQVDEAMARMKKEMEGVPPEQRAMMEKMMAGMGGGAAKAPVRVVKKTDDSKTINGFPCTRYLVSLDGKASSEIWAAPFEKLELKKSDLKIFEDMIKLFDGLLSRFKGMSKRGQGMVNSDGIDGVPIQTTTFDSDGKPNGVTNLESVTRGAVDAKLFELPAGYAKQEMGGKK